VVEDPALRLGQGDRLSQQVVHVDHVDAPVAHLGDEVEMVPPGVLHPHHVVEQELVAVARGQPLVGSARCAHHHLSQLAHLGVDAER